MTINTDLLTSEARENLNDFVDQVQNYVNSYRWTNEDLGNEKISFTLNISFQGSPSPNRYTAQAYIGSSRKIYGQDKNTALLRLLDDNWEFLYQPNQQILHDESLAQIARLDLKPQALVALLHDTAASVFGLPPHPAEPAAETSPATA